MSNNKPQYVVGSKSNYHPETGKRVIELCYSGGQLSKADFYDKDGKSVGTENDLGKIVHKVESLSYSQYYRPDVPQPTLKQTNNIGSSTDVTTQKVEQSKAESGLSTTEELKVNEVKESNPAASSPAIEKLDVASLKTQLNQQNTEKLTAELEGRFDVILLQIITFIARSDGDFSKAEVNLINKLQEVSYLSAESIEVFTKETKEAEDLKQYLVDSIEKYIPVYTQEHKRKLLEVAIWTVFADGEIAKGEEKALVALGNTIGITQTEYEQIVKEAPEKLVKLLRKKEEIPNLKATSDSQSKKATSADIDTTDPLKKNINLSTLALVSSVGLGLLVMAGNEGNFAYKASIFLGVSNLLLAPFLFLSLIQGSFLALGIKSRSKLFVAFIISGITCLFSIGTAGVLQEKMKLKKTSAVETQQKR
tara:strand:- start:1527 stop:2789 length:1263 start_codon:yes stop_codon:yes gene_type:complete